MEGEDSIGEKGMAMNVNGLQAGNGKQKSSTSTSTPGEEKKSTEPPGILREASAAAPRKWNTDIPDILPHERVFPIQIGSELFRLSGASISSDGMHSSSIWSGVECG